MANVLDVARYILSITGEIPAMKLHRLIYYCQAWSLVWDEEPLFDEPIEAWSSGPIIPFLFKHHRGWLVVNKDNFNYGNVDILTFNQQDSINKVLEALQEKSGQWLADLSRSETPWIKARGNLNPMERGNEIISIVDIHEYYSTL